MLDPNRLNMFNLDVFATSHRKKLHPGEGNRCVSYPQSSTSDHVPLYYFLLPEHAPYSSDLQLAAWS